MEVWPYLIPAALLIGETGFLAGLFVPGGDTLLLALGVLAGEGELHLGLLLAVLFVASVVGHNLGYAWGRWLGPKALERIPEKYLTQVNSLYARYGSALVMISPLIPVLRTFTPFVMGAVGMPWLRYFALSLLGTLAWTQGITLLGYFLGRVLPHWAVLLLVFGLLALAFVPTAWRWWREARGWKGVGA